VTLKAPRDPDQVSCFLNIRVAGIYAIYKSWRDRQRTALRLGQWPTSRPAR
jgi:hypothetical protein